MNILLKDSIDTLKQLKMEMHDVMDSSAQAKLEQVIQDLEQHDNLTRGLGSKIYFKGFSRNILSSILYKSSCL